MNWFKRKLLNFITKHLFNGITEDDILKYNKNNNSIHIGDTELSVNQIEALSSGAQALQHSPFFQALIKDMKYQSNRRMYQGSQSDNDIIFGKSCLWNIDIMEREIDRFANLDISKLQKSEQEEEKEID